MPSRRAARNAVDDLHSARPRSGRDDDRRAAVLQPGTTSAPSQERREPATRRWRPARTEPAGAGAAPLVPGRGLKVHFPIRAAVRRAAPSAPSGPSTASTSTVPRASTRGPGRGVRLRQVDAGRAVLRLRPITAGTVSFDGTDVSACRARHCGRPRRRHADGVPGPARQPEPAAERRDDPRPSRWGARRSPASRAHRVRELLDHVGLPAARRRYPHEFSGGQRQRIGIARALALEPRCSSPTSRSPPSTCRSRPRCSTCSRTCSSELGLTYLVIAHDLAVVRHVSDGVAVMYLGSIVEQADADDLYARAAAPLHPALMSAVPGARPGGRGQPGADPARRATCRHRRTRRRAAASTPAARSGRRRAATTSGPELVRGASGSPGGLPLRRGDRPGRDHRPTRD